MKVNDPSIFSDASVMATVIREASEELTYNDSYVVLAEYYDVVEQAILDSGIAYLPAKSSEFKHKEKPLTDQPMISHLRNGVHAIVESNRTLHMMRKDSALNNDELKKVIALYVAHELHKLNPRQNKDQFDISEDEALKWIIQFNLLSFAPSLTSLDYQSVATSNHSKIGFHTNLSKEYILYKPWIQLADALSSITTPKTTDHLQSLLNKIDCDLKFAYHTLNSSTGITTNIINSAIIDWASKEGLIPLLIFESGILYITDNKNEHKLTNKQDIEDIYNHFKNKLKNSHLAIREPEALQKSKTVDGSKGLYRVEDSMIFLSGIDLVTNGLLFAGVLEDENKNKNNHSVVIDVTNSILTIDNSPISMRNPPADVLEISPEYISSIKTDEKDVAIGYVKIYCRSVEDIKDKSVLIPVAIEIDGKTPQNAVITIDGIGLTASQIGYRHHIMKDFNVDIGLSAQQISYSRMISSIRLLLIDPLVNIGILSPEAQLYETCKLFQVNDELTQKLVESQKDEIVTKNHTAGGYWNYAYVIAYDILNRNVNGTLFKDLDTNERIKILIQLASEYLSTLSPEDKEKLESMYSYPYKEKILVWLCENLNFNGSMLYGVFTDKTTKLEAYNRGRGTCKLTNEPPYDIQPVDVIPVLAQDTSFLKHSYSERSSIGGSKPSLDVSVVVAIELQLRKLGHGIKKVVNEKVTFKLIPDYFQIPLINRIISSIMGMFDESASTDLIGIARSIISTDKPMYYTTSKDLISEHGPRIFRYTAKDFDVYSSNYNIIFNAKRESNKEEEYWFSCLYAGMILSVVTGCRLIISQNPICTTNGDEFPEMINVESSSPMVNRIFGNNIPLSKLNHFLKLSSLILSLSSERDYKLTLLTKHLRMIKSHMFPGSTILKEIQRNMKQQHIPDGVIQNKLRGYSRDDDGNIINNETLGLIDQAIQLNQCGDNMKTQNSMQDLAILSLRVAIPQGYEPHRVEKILRESTDAILAVKACNFDRDTLIAGVSGRLSKMMRRARNDQFYYVEGLYNKQRLDEFSENFVDLVFYKLSEGKYEKMKAMINQLADAFYNLILKHRGDELNRAKAEKKARDEETKTDKEAQ